MLKIAFRKITGDSSDLNNVRYRTGRELLAALLFELNEDFGEVPELGRRSSGKPFFVNLPYCFSISHSGEYCICALGSGEVGADIEKHSRVRDLVMKRVYTQEEADRVEASEDRIKTFFDIWTCREARVKYTGEGIQGILRGREEQPARLLKKNLNIYNIDITDGYSAAICTEETRPPEIREY